MIKFLSGGSLFCYCSLQHLIFSNLIFTLNYIFILYIKFHFTNVLSKTKFIWRIAWYCSGFNGWFNWVINVIINNSFSIITSSYIIVSPNSISLNGSIADDALTNGLITNDIAIISLCITHITNS